VHVVYNALDYGMEEEAERVLTPELERFLERMTDAGQYQNHFLNFNLLHKENIDRQTDT
jgi:hypothetical protein